MSVNKIFTLFFLFIFSFSPLVAANIGLLITATGKYIQFIEPLLQSADNHFCQNHQVTYFVFTDSFPPPRANTIWIYHKKLGWPFDTLMRFETYLHQKELLKNQDYLFCCDADMLFVGKVGGEILSDLVATEHPGFVGKRGSYETNPLSSACIFDNEGERYFAGGFYGGSSKEVLKLCKITTENIYSDLKKGMIAVWHDESHLNRYFIDHKPTKILSPSYCYPESWLLNYPKKLLALDKNHSAMRE